MAIELNGLTDRAAWHVEVPDVVPAAMPAGDAATKLNALARSLTTKLRAFLRGMGLTNPSSGNLVLTLAQVQNMAGTAQALKSRAPNAQSFLVGEVTFARLAGLSQAVTNASAPIIALSDPRVQLKLSYVTFPKSGESDNRFYWLQSEREANAREAGGTSGLMPLGEFALLPFGASGQVGFSAVPRLPRIQEFTLTQGVGESLDTMLGRISAFLMIPRSLDASVTERLDAAAARAQAEVERQAAEARAQAEEAERRASEARTQAEAEEAARRAAEAAARAAEAEAAAAAAVAAQQAADEERARQAQEAAAREARAREAAAAAARTQAVAAADRTRRWQNLGLLGMFVAGTVTAGVLIAKR